MDERWDEIETAPAKINLALHVTGQRADGFHTLESLVTFAKAGDSVKLRASDEDRFAVRGPFAKTLTADGHENLVTRARDALRSAFADHGLSAPPVEIQLTKNLPVASGIGGGSADAAAVIRALLRHWDGTLPESVVTPLCLALGADVPMCLNGAPLVARGVGEAISPLGGLPSFSTILINPRIGVSTPEIFRRLTRRKNPPLPAIPGIDGVKEWADFLLGLRNDLEPAARALVGEISDAIALLSDSGALLARMSGSGATCFGLYADKAAADSAFVALEAACPDWYLMRTETVGVVRN